MSDSPEIENAIGNIGKYDLIVFSSANGVESFFHALNEYGKDARALAGALIAVIGPATADAVSNHGVYAEIKAEKFIAEGLFNSIREKIDLKNKKVLLAGSNIGRKTLEEGLIENGANTERVIFYKTEPEEIGVYAKSFMLKGKADIVTFTSSSTVNSFFGQVNPDEIPGNTKYASIGPETSATLKKYGIIPHVEAAEYTADGLVRAIVGRFGNIYT
jgi:uroporphyrinogen III methyltransferase / synthase